MFMPTCIVLHDTVSPSGRGSMGYLKKKGYSSHFFIERNGTIVAFGNTSTNPKVVGKQLTDDVYTSENNVYLPGRHVATPGWNGVSLGIDLVGWVQPSYVPRGKASEWPLIERPWSPYPGDKVVALTGAQGEALNTLLQGLCQKYDIPKVLALPIKGGGSLMGSLNSNNFRGIVAHGQIQANRQDGLLGLDWLVSHYPDVWKPM